MARTDLAVVPVTYSRSRYLGFGRGARDLLLLVREAVMAAYPGGEAAAADRAPPVRDSRSRGHR